jgi:glycosyltransferase involved in cell wall biosynthesis
MATLDATPPKSTRPRSLHVGKYFPPFTGGMERFLADLLSAMHEQGAAVAALVHEHRPSRQSGGEMGWPFPVRRVPSYGRLVYAPVSPAFPRELARSIRQFKPDILHLHLPNTSAFWALALPAARRLPWVVHWHSDVVISGLDRRLALAYPVYRPLEQRLLTRAAAIVATSPPYLASSTALARWRDKCRVIPLGLNPAGLPVPGAEELAAAHARWGSGALRVLTVGRLSYYKGHEVLIDAVARVPGARLIIIGSGERQALLRTRVQELRLEGRAELAGNCSAGERNALLATCDLFCLPSVERTEAFGMALLEAMRYGRPVLASAIPGSGVGWVVQDGMTGILVPPGDPEALAMGIARLRSMDRDALGRAGRKRLKQRFHIRQLAQAMIDLYRELMPGRP